MKAFNASPQTHPLVGVGLRHPHYNDALLNTKHQTPTSTIDFVEIHAENFFAKGGISQTLLRDVSEKYPVSVHGTSLGLGSELEIPPHILAQFAEVVETSQAMLVSEHLCFNRAKIGDTVLHSGDLLPLAYNQASLDLLGRNIDHVQSRLKRPILIENLSAYISASDVQDEALDDRSEIDFLIDLCKHAGCGLLLDLNNMIVNAINQNQVDIVSTILQQVQRLPPAIVGEIHLAGFSPKQVQGFVVDDHACAVSEQCWALYREVIKTFGHKPTLIEWDNNLPEWNVLLAEAERARSYC